MGYAVNGTTRIWWDQQGEGPPLLLAMGHMWDSQMWWRALPALTAAYRVIWFDNRGAGRTEWDGTGFDIEDLAADAFAVLDDAGVETADLYGMSMGGLTVQEMALSEPGRVRSLILGCTAAFGPADKQGSARRDAMVAHTPRWLTLRLMPKLLYGPDADPGALAEDLRIQRDARIPPAAVLAQRVAVGRYRSFDRVGKIGVPTLILHGEVDKAVPVARGRELAERIPGAKLVVLPRAGHNYLADSGTTAMDEVLAFLGSHAA